MVWTGILQGAICVSSVLFRAQRRRSCRARAARKRGGGSGGGGCSTVGRRRADGARRWLRFALVRRAAARLRARPAPASASYAASPPNLGCFGAPPGAGLAVRLGGRVSRPGLAQSLVDPCANTPGNCLQFQLLATRSALRLRGWQGAPSDTPMRCLASAHALTRASIWLTVRRLSGALGLPATPRRDPVPNSFWSKGLDLENEPIGRATTPGNSVSIAT